MPQSIALQSRTFPVHWDFPTRPSEMNCIKIKIKYKYIYTLIHMDSYVINRSGRLYRYKWSNHHQEIVTIIYKQRFQYKIELDNFRNKVREWSWVSWRKAGQLLWASKKRFAFETVESLRLLRLAYSLINSKLFEMLRTNIDQETRPFPSVRSFSVQGIAIQGIHKWFQIGFAHFGENEGWQGWLSGSHCKLLRGLSGCSRIRTGVNDPDALMDIFIVPRMAKYNVSDSDKLNVQFLLYSSGQVW